jgi:hypothetical protein
VFSDTGQVVESSPSEVRVRLASNGHVVDVPFDNFLSSTPPAPAATVTVYWRGWVFGAVKPRPTWSLEATTMVTTPDGLDVIGFRRGTRRHLKFLIHEAGCDRADFTRRAGDWTLQRLGASHARQVASLAVAGCPAAGAGSDACQFVDSKSCSHTPYWQLDAGIGVAVRTYESRAFDLLASKDTVRCVIVSTLTTTEPGEGRAGRFFDLLLVAHRSSGEFVQAARVVGGELPYCLLTSYVANRRDAVGKLLRTAARAERVMQFTAPRDMGQALSLQLLTLRRHPRRA